MKRILITAATAACTLFMGSGFTFAQEGVPELRPIEMWVCNYRDGKDQGDFDDVLEDTVESAGDDPYAAFQLSPYFVSGDQDFDFIYLGVWENGTTMGSDMAEYAATSGDIDEAWNDAVDCPASIMYASMRIQQNDGGGDGNFMLSISDCNVAHGASTGQALGALTRFNNYRVANGSTVGTIAWFPIYGAGAVEFDFKLVHVYSGWPHFGDSFQWFVDNQAYLVQEDVLDGVVSCDVPRLYNGETILNNLNQD
jgi:hypothetical protein